MQKFLPLSVLFLCTIVQITDTSDARKHVMSLVASSTPGHTIQDLICIWEASDRKDYVGLLIKLIDVYDDINGAYPFFTKLPVHVFQKVLLRFQGIYWKIFPQKRPKNVTLADLTLKKISDGLDGKFITSAFSKFTGLDESVVKETSSKITSFINSDGFKNTFDKVLSGNASSVVKDAFSLLTKDSDNDVLKSTLTKAVAGINDTVIDETVDKVLHKATDVYKKWEEPLMGKLQSFLFS